MHGCQETGDGPFDVRPDMTRKSAARTGMFVDLQMRGSSYTMSPLPIQRAFSNPSSGKSSMYAAMSGSPTGSAASPRCGGPGSTNSPGTGTLTGSTTSHGQAAVFAARSTPTGCRPHRMLPIPWNGMRGERDTRNSA